MKKCDMENMLILFLFKKTDLKTICNKMYYKDYIVRKDIKINSIQKIHNQQIKT